MKWNILKRKKVDIFREENMGGVEEVDIFREENMGIKG